MDIRTQTAADRPACLAVVTEGFGTGNSPEPIETSLLRELFECVEHIPELSIVAESGDAIVGHVITTRASIGDVPSLGLGPIAVSPNRQRQGIGSVLVRATIQRATDLGESTIVLLGDPAFYERFGFVRADVLGIEPPQDWGVHFMVRPLDDVPLPQGRFRYAEPFSKL